jgi:hypothetical protein
VRLHDEEIPEKVFEFSILEQEIQNFEEVHHSEDDETDREDDVNDFADLDDCWVLTCCSCHFRACSSLFLCLLLDFLPFLFAFYCESCLFA